MNMLLVSYVLPPVTAFAWELVVNKSSQKIQNYIFDRFLISPFDSVKNETLRQKVYRFSSLSCAYLGAHSVGYLTGLTLTGMKVSLVAFGGASALTFIGVVMIASRFEWSGGMLKPHLHAMVVIAGWSTIQGFYWASNADLFAKKCLTILRSGVDKFNLGARTLKIVDASGPLFKALLIAGRILPSWYSLKRIHSPLMHDSYWSDVQTNHSR